MLIRRNVGVNLNTSSPDGSFIFNPDFVNNPDNQGINIKYESNRIEISKNKYKAIFFGNNFIPTAENPNLLQFSGFIQNIISYENDIIDLEMIGVNANYTDIVGKTWGEILTSNDVIYGANTNLVEEYDWLYGYAGDDKIYARDGSDLLDGGSGNDTLDGGAGNDTIRGGLGNDSAVYSGRKDEYTIQKLADGTLKITDKSAGYVDTLTSIEVLKFADQQLNVSDIVAPPVIDSINLPVITRKPVINGSGEVGRTIKILSGTVELGSGVVGLDGRFSITLTSEISLNSTDIYATAQIGSGIPSDQSNVISLKYMFADNVSIALNKLTVNPNLVLAISDTAANIIAKLTELQAASTASKIAVISMEGNYTTPISVDTASRITSLQNFKLGQSATFIISDTSANILQTSNPTALSYASSIRLSSSATASLTDSIKLSSFNDFNTAANITLTISNAASAHLNVQNSLKLTKISNLERNPS